MIGHVARRAVLALQIAGLALTTHAALAAESAVVFMYHHVDAGTPPSTSVTPERFRQHLDYLDRDGFDVLPLMVVLNALREGRSLPEKTVVITFDDGYTSVLNEALPELEQRGWPFTVFVSTDAIDRGYGGYLSWDDLRRLARSGATIGNHTVTHPHLVRRKDAEREDQWRARVEAEISEASGRIDAEVGDAAIPVLAYPYGEYDTALEEIVGSLGLYAFGQHSGAIGPQSDFLALPRFPLATGYDGLDELALRARTRPLPARVVGSERHVAAPDEERPSLRFELPADGDFRREELACYASGQGRMTLRWLDAGETSFEIAPVRPIGPGRTKYNCTAPSRSESEVYYWHSYLWMKPNADGSWYAE